MTTIAEPMLNEFREETNITRRILDRVPADKLTWKPHPKSMTLGQLAIHIAVVPGRLAALATQTDASMWRKETSCPISRKISKRSTPPSKTASSRLRVA